MRDWRRLPYWATQVEVDQSIGELRKSLKKHGVGAVQVTSCEDPWHIEIAWEMFVPSASVSAIVSFDVTIDDNELEQFTEKQGEAIKRQAVRLIAYTVKNLLAVVESEMITLEELFIGRMRVSHDEEGRPVTVGRLVLEQAARTGGRIGPTIVQKALPAGPR